MVLYRRINDTTNSALVCDRFRAEWEEDNRTEMVCARVIGLVSLVFSDNKETLLCAIRGQK